MALNNDSNIENIESMDSLVKKDKKFIVFSIFIIIGLILLFLLFNFIFKSKKLAEDEILINEDALIMIKEDEKYGYIDTEGNKVIDCKYDSAETFKGEYTKVKEDEVFKLIDKKGNDKFESKTSSDIEYLEDYHVWIINNELYDYNLKKLSKKNVEVKYYNYGYFKWVNKEDKKAGIMNSKGEVTYTYKLDKEDETFVINDISYQSKDDLEHYYCTVNIDTNKYAIINCSSGKEVYEFTENNISNKVSSCYELKKLKNLSFINRFFIVNDKVVYTTEDKTEVVYNYDNYFNIYSSKDRKNFYISKTDGKEYNEEPKRDITNSEKNEIEKELELEKVVCEDGFGLRKGNKEKLKCEWDEIIFFDINITKYLVYKDKNYVLVKKGDEYKLVNFDKNKVITTFNTDRISIIKNSLFIEYVDKDDNKKYVYSLLKNKQKDYDNDTKIALYTNYYTVKSGDKLEYYNIKMDKIFSN